MKRLKNLFIGILLTYSGCYLMFTYDSEEEASKKALKKSKKEAEINARQNAKDEKLAKELALFDSLDINVFLTSDHPKNEDDWSSPVKNPWLAIGFNLNPDSLPSFSPKYGYPTQTALLLKFTTKDSVKYLRKYLITNFNTSKGGTAHSLFNDYIPENPYYFYDLIGLTSINERGNKLLRRNADSFEQTNLEKIEIFIFTGLKINLEEEKIPESNVLKYSWEWSFSEELYSKTIYPNQ